MFALKLSRLKFSMFLLFHFHRAKEGHRRRTCLGIAQPSRKHCIQNTICLEKLSDTIYQILAVPYCILFYCSSE